MSGDPVSLPYRPFRQAADFVAWSEANCWQCEKGPAPDQDGENEACDIENALTLSSLCGGSINDPIIGGPVKAAEIAERLGWNGISSLPCKCREFVAKAESEVEP